MTSSASKSCWRIRVNSKIRRGRSGNPAARRVAEVFGLTDGRPKRGTVNRGTGLKPVPAQLKKLCHEKPCHVETLYDNFELTIRPGQITAVVGPSGAGKSVLLRLAAQRLPKTVHLCPERLGRSNLPPVAILKGGTLTDRLAILSQCGLAEATVLITPAKHLSGGQLYRLALAEAFWSASRTGRPAVVVADEFAASLDTLTAENLCRQVRRLIGRTKVSLLLATPRMELLGPLAPDQTVIKPLGQPPKLVAGDGNGGGNREPETGNRQQQKQRQRRDNWGSCHPQGAVCLGGVLPGTRGGTAFPGCAAQAGKPVPPDGDADDPAGWVIQRGSIGDYRALADFHYIAGPPAAHKRVYVIRPPARSDGDRLLTPPVAAVLVVSPPLGCVASRDIATAGRYAGRDRSEAISLLNAEMECISRVIVHPVFRGLGLAVRLVRHALATSQTPWMEALAVMGQINPFFERAGMAPYRKAGDDGSGYVYYLARTAATGNRQPATGNDA